MNETICLKINKTDKKIMEKEKLQVGKIKTKMECDIVEMNIPLLDLKAQYATIKDEVHTALEPIFTNTAYILGDAVFNFEKQFASFCGEKDCVAVNSGTAALHLALLALGIKQGDEVITTPFTFIATAEAVSHCEATPVFIDIDPETYCIDPSKIEAAITEKTKAIIPVHLYGHPCDMDAINEIAQKHNLFVIEDCCQAHASEYKGKRVPISGIGCFSFYPSKNLGAFGEGGAVVSSDEQFMEKVRLLRAHGENPKNNHKIVGYNYRMSGIQGAILGAKLKHLPEWTEGRRKNAARYNSALEGTSLKLPTERENSKHVYHLYVTESEKRDELSKFLSGKGIASAVHYPVPCHLQPAYSCLGMTEGSLPVCEAAAKRVLSLPMYPELTEEQVQYVAEAVKEFEQQ